MNARVSRQHRHLRESTPQSANAVSQTRLHFTPRQRRHVPEHGEAAGGAPHVTPAQRGGHRVGPLARDAVVHLRPPNTSVGWSAAQKPVPNFDSYRGGHSSHLIQAMPPLPPPPPPRGPGGSLPCPHITHTVDTSRIRVLVQRPRTEFGWSLSRGVHFRLYGCAPAGAGG